MTKTQKKNLATELTPEVSVKQRKDRCKGMWDAQFFHC